MTSAPRRTRRRSIGTVVSGALAATVAAVTLGVAPDAGSVPGVDFARIAGADRYATAAAVATSTFSSSAIALLASGEDFADAMAANYLAGVGDAPILLASTNDVPAATITALQSLGVDFVVLVGGTQRLSPAVANELTAAGFPNARVAGADRYETAKALSFVTGGPTVGTDQAGRRTAILAAGNNAADALAAGPLAYADGFPLLLTPPNGLHPAAEEALRTLDIDHVLITGGEIAINPNVEQRLQQLGYTTERLAGLDRFGTAAAIATKAVTALGHSDAHVDVATAFGFADALAAGPHAGRGEGVILLAPEGTPTLDQPTCAYLAGRAASVTSGHVIGGERAVSLETETALEACAGGGTPGPGPGGDPNIDVPVAPVGDRVVALGGEGASFNYTFTSVPSVVDVALLPCFARLPGTETAISDDPVALDGTFDPDADNHTVARTDHLGQTFRSVRLPASGGGARIVAANGAIAPTTYVDGLAVPASTSLAITVTATAADCAIPVVFEDVVDDDDLDLDLFDRPIDRFGIGGAAVATAGEAPEDTPIAGEILYLDEAGDRFVLANGFQYDYGDAGDSYRYQTFSLNNVGEFEAALSALDTLGVVGAAVPYQRAEPNRFDLGGDVSGRATGLQTVVGDLDGVASDNTLNDVRVAWVAPSPADGLVVDYAVDVYRCAPSCVLDRQVLDSDHEPASAVPPVNQDVNNDNVDDDVDRQVVVEDLPAGTYGFVVSAVTFAGQRSAFGSTPATTSSAAPPGAPHSISTDFTEGAGTLGIVDVGDLLRLTFDEPMAPPQAGDALALRDGAGHTATLVHGANATFSVLTDVISIRVDAAVAAGQLAYAGLVVTGSGGITDVGGTEWHIAGSPDSSF